MQKALGLAPDLLTAINSRNVNEACRIVDELKALMDTYKYSC